LLHRNIFRFHDGNGIKIFRNGDQFFNVSKLNKIARCGLKIQKFAWRYEIKFGTLIRI
jgi:hypothetical protein